MPVNITMQKPLISLLDKSALDAVPSNLTPVARALSSIKAGRAAGFAFDNAEQIVVNARGELQELEQEVSDNSCLKKQQDEFGDTLFAMITLAEFLNLDLEKAFNGAFERTKNTHHKCSNMPQDAFNAVKLELRRLAEAISQKASNDQLAENLSDLLFATVKLSQVLSLVIEKSLDSTCDKFNRRFRYMEAAIAAQGSSLRQVSRIDQLKKWNEGKQFDPPPLDYVSPPPAYGPSL